MTAPVPVAVAPNFHLDELPGGRWEAAAGADVTHCGTTLLFALPGHLRASFWSVLEQGDAPANFDVLAAEVGRFLAFKELSPPPGAVFEVILHGASGVVEPRGLWAVINLGDDLVAVEVPGLRIFLGAGEGAQFPDGPVAAVQPPTSDVPMQILLAVRRPGFETESATRPMG
jgi:hypothetical protein